MIPIFLIILGVVIIFFSAVSLLRFTYELSEKIRELNSLFSSDAFLLHKNLKNEIDELNYSYYEILEMQDKRISELEKHLKNNKKEENLENNKQTSEKKRDTSFEKFSQKEKIKQRVLELRKKGATKTQIASKLDIGIGIVDLICSVYKV